MSSPPPGTEGQEEMAFEGSTSWGLHRGLAGVLGRPGRQPFPPGPLTTQTGWQSPAVMELGGTRAVAWGPVMGVAGGVQGTRGATPSGQCDSAGGQWLGQYH